MILILQPVHVFFFLFFCCSVIYALKEIGIFLHVYLHSMTTSNLTHILNLQNEKYVIPLQFLNLDEIVAHLLWK